MRFNPKAKTDNKQVTFSRNKHYSSPLAKQMQAAASAKLRKYSAKQKIKRLK